MPAASSRSACARIPAVSTRRTGTPSMARVSSIVSRVVPDTSETMARSAPSSALSSDDLPALGGPTIATLRPSRTNCPSSPSRRRRSSRSRTGARRPSNARRSGSGTSSGKSIAAASSSSSAASSARSARTSPARPPPRFASAARMAERVSASMTSATAAAALRSILPLRNARRVNSPGCASRAPQAKSARTTSRAPTGEPWTCSSSISSPV